MTFRTYLPIATTAVAAAMFSVVDGARGQTPEPLPKTAVHLVVAGAEMTPWSERKVLDHLEPADLGRRGGERH